MMLGRISDEVLYNFFFTKIFNSLVPKLLKLSHIIKYLNYKNLFFCKSVRNCLLDVGDVEKVLRKNRKSNVNLMVNGNVNSSLLTYIQVLNL